MNTKQMRDHISKQCGFTSCEETPVTVANNATTETRDTFAEPNKIQFFVEHGELPLEYLREYDGAAEHYAKRGELPHCMGTPGALDYIWADPEAFDQRVNDFRYAAAMEANKAKPIITAEQAHYMAIMHDLDKLDREIETQNKAKVPESFEDWIKQGNDAIDDPGGNIIPSRVLANHDQYDNERHPFS